MGNNSRLGSEHVELVKKYFSLRLKKQTDDVLDLVCEDIEFYSQRDGSFAGKKEFRKYLEKTKIEGKWQPPALEDDDTHVVVRGVVKIMLIPINIKSVFDFNEAGQICKIHTCKA